MPDYCWYAPAAQDAAVVERAWEARMPSRKPPPEGHGGERTICSIWQRCMRRWRGGDANRIHGLNDSSCLLDEVPDLARRIIAFPHHRLSSLTFPVIVVACSLHKQLQSLATLVEVAK